MNGVRRFILLVFRPNISNGRSYSIQHARYTDMCPRASRRLMPFLDVVSWVRIPLGRVDVIVVFVIMYCVGVGGLETRRYVDIAGSPTEYLSPSWVSQTSRDYRQPHGCSPH